MRLATAAQCKELDELAVSRFGLSNEVLMEAAGVMASRELDQSFYPELKRGHTALVCGPGNNGADGLVMARHLHSAGHRDLMVFLVAPDKARSDLFQQQLRRLELSGIRAYDLLTHPEKGELIQSASLVVDAVFGIGLSREVQEPFLSVIDKMNGLKVPIVSLDVPSGLNSDTGTIWGACIQAEATFTFGVAKPGFFVGEGALNVGKLRILSIGYPYELIRGLATKYFAFTEKLSRRYLPKRREDSNKSDHGRALVIAGSEGTWGAGLLCSSSCYRMGSGYVQWMSFEDPTVAIRDIPEVMASAFDDNALDNERLNAVAIGPGLGVNENTARVLKLLKEKEVEKVVVDADAITACVQYDLWPLPSSWILTPHSGEIARILKVSTAEIQRDRFGFALKAAQLTGCHVLLKGFRSVLAYEDRCLVIFSGNSALAKAGTGDVLTGMIAGLLAQGLPTLQATATAAYIHGRMADEWVRTGKDRRSLMASDLRDHLPSLMSRLSHGVLL